MFDYLELEYEVKRRRGLVNPKRKLYERKKTSLLLLFSNLLINYKLKFSSNYQNVYMSFITLVVVISTTIVLCQPIISNFREYSNRQTKATNAAYKNKNRVAFNFLINSGKNRLLEGRISSAYKEFKLAHAIYPENEMLNNLLIETLNILCEKENIYCDELDEFLLNSY